MSKVNFLICFIIFSTHVFAQQKRSYRTVIFETIVNGKKLVLNDSIYTNPFKETYIVTKLKYYVSNIRFIESAKSEIKKSVYLIDELNNSQFTMLGIMTQK